MSFLDNDVLDQTSLIFLELYKKCHYFIVVHTHTPLQTLAKKNINHLPLFIKSVTKRLVIISKCKIYPHGERKSLSSSIFKNIFTVP